MSSVVISGDTSGAITLSAPAVSGTNTATLPAATGTVMVSGNMPAFSASSSSGTSVPASTFTKVALQTENFDTNNCFDNSTNYRFTPNIAGYYQINACVGLGTAAASSLVVIYKNGSQYLYGTVGGFTVSAINTQSSASALIYFNGSTDYIEMYAYQSSGSTQTTQTGVTTQFSGSLVRSA